MNVSARLPFALSILVACATSLACGPDPSVTPEITAKPGEGSTELVFRIARHERRPDGSQLLSAVAMLHGRPVGFDLDLGAWHENPPGFVNMTTWDCNGRLLSQGASSDELLILLDQLYGTRLAPTRMVDSAEVQAIALSKNPGDFKGDAARFLLHFPTEFGDGPWAELNLRVDADHARIHVREKEPRLRPLVITALSAAP